MYGREIAGRERIFETSGALYHGALVMQDDVTDSYWAVVSGAAIAGLEAGTRLQELPIAEKLTWGEWRRRNPDTKVLSVDGREHVESSPYQAYFDSDETFRGLSSGDDRLPGKAAVVAVESGGRSWVLPHRNAEGGWLGHLGDLPVLIWRPQGASLHRSTRIWSLAGDGAASLLRVTEEGAFVAGSDRLDPVTGLFESGERLEAVPGLDTFWVVWSLYHPGSVLLGRDQRGGDGRNGSGPAPMGDR